MAKTKSKGLMAVLQIVDYKDGSILIRKFPEDMYVWDVYFKGKFYSSYVVIKPIKGKKKLNNDELAEVVKICYAGAAATIDYQLGEKLSKTDEQMFKQFEEGRKSIGGQA